MSNARDPDGLTHLCELEPCYHPANPDHCVKAGFTWCLIFFTWVGEPRYHPPSDSAEFRLIKTDDVPTCLACITVSLGLVHTDSIL